MEPVIVYYTDNPVINGSGEGDNNNQPAIDENNNINDDDDDDNGIHHLPDEFYDAQTEQMGNPSYGIDIPTTSSTRAGRISRPPPRLIKTATMAQEMNNKAADYKCKLTPAEERYYEAMRELNEMALIGAGIGGGFVNTEELHVMNYNEAIKSEKDKWDYAVKEEHDQMIDNKVLQPVPIDEIPEGAKIMTSAWAMKKKSNGTYRARINA
jgi:ubiquitin